MTCLHYACHFPSLTMIIDLLTSTNLSPLAIDSFLRMPSQLIPLSHLTSKKSLLVVEKEKMFQKLYPKPYMLEPSTPNVTSKQEFSEYLKDKMQVPLERSFTFEEDDFTEPELTQRPRCFPSKTNIFIKVKTPSEKLLQKNSIKIGRKTDSFLQDYSKAVIPSVNTRHTMRNPEAPKPLKLSMKGIPSLKVGSFTSLNQEAAPGKNKESAIEKESERVKQVETTH